MGTRSAGVVAIIPLPFSGLSQSKRRPALVLAEAGKDEFILCQITSKQYGDSHALLLIKAVFISGSLRRESFIRVGKLFTANQALIVEVAGRLESAKTAEAIARLDETLSACIKDNAF
jgi:mRNA interferase MazF